DSRDAGRSTVSAPSGVDARAFLPAGPAGGAVRSRALSRLVGTADIPRLVYARGPVYRRARGHGGLPGSLCLPLQQPMGQRQQ
ncbi:unnamed protein product, partial [Symbiodinium sp. KB8]